VLQKSTCRRRRRRPARHRFAPVSDGCRGCAALSSSFVGGGQRVGIQLGRRRSGPGVSGCARATLAGWCRPLFFQGGLEDFIDVCLHLGTRGITALQELLVND